MKEQRSVWHTSLRSNNGQCSSTIKKNRWSNNDDNDDDDDDQIYIEKYCDCCSPFWECFLVGILSAALILAILITLWLTSKTVTTTNSVMMQSSSTIVTAVSVTTSNGMTTSTTASPICANSLWNTTGETVAGIAGSPGSASDQLHSPWNIFIDETNNNLYIADSGNNRIQRWSIGSSSGTTIAGTGVSGSLNTQLNTPQDVFVDSSQNIYVADSGNNRIQYFSFGNTTGITMTTSWSSPGSLWGVQLFNQSVYACDFSKSIIWRNGTTVASSLNSPQGFTVDTSVSPGTIYIANSGQQTIVKWSVGASSGSVVAGVSSTGGSTSTTLHYPTTVRLDSNGNIFVVDNNNHRIQLFCQYPTANTSARTIAGTTGVPGQTADTLNYPEGIALDSSLNLYVSDTSNHRIQRFKRLI